MAASGKFAAKKHPFLVEDTIKSIEAPRQMKDREMEQFFHQGYSSAPTAQMRAAFANQWVKDLKNKKSDAIDSNFADEFRAWLCGNSRYNKFEHETTWADKPLFHIKGVRDYLSRELDMHWEFRRALIHLHTWGPKNLKEAYLYFKYIVCAYDWVQRKDNADDPMAQIPPWYNRAGMIDFLDQYAMPPDLNDPIQNHPTSDVHRGNGTKPLVERENTDRAKFLEEHLALLELQGPGSTGGEEKRNRELRAAANARLYREAQQYPRVEFTDGKQADLLRAMVEGKKDAVLLFLGQRAVDLYEEPMEGEGPQAEMQAAANARAQAVVATREEYEAYVRQTRGDLTARLRQALAQQLAADYEQYELNYLEQANALRIHIENLERDEQRINEFDEQSREELQRSLEDYRRRQQALEETRDERDAQVAREILQQFMIDHESPDPEVVSEMIAQLEREEAQMDIQTMMQDRARMIDELTQLEQQAVEGSEQAQELARERLREYSEVFAKAGYNVGDTPLREVARGINIPESPEDAAIAERIDALRVARANAVVIEPAVIPQAIRERQQQLLEQNRERLQEKRQADQQRFQQTITWLNAWNGGPAGYEQVAQITALYNGALRADTAHELQALLQADGYSIDRAAELYLEHTELVANQARAAQILELIQQKRQQYQARVHDEKLGRNQRAQNFLGGLEYELRIQRAAAEQRNAQYLGQVQAEHDEAMELEQEQAEQQAMEAEAEDELQRAAAVADVRARHMRLRAEQLAVGVLVDSLADLPPGNLTERVRQRFQEAADAEAAANIIHELTEVTYNSLRESHAVIERVSQIVVESPHETRQELEALRPELEHLSQALNIIERLENLRDRPIEFSNEFGQRRAEFLARYQYVAALADANKPREAGREGADISFGALVSNLPDAVVQNPAFWLGRGVKRAAVRPGALRGVQHPTSIASGHPYWHMALNKALEQYYALSKADRVARNQTYRVEMRRSDRAIAEALTAPGGLDAEQFKALIAEPALKYPDAAIQIAAPFRAYAVSQPPGTPDAALIHGFANLYTDRLTVVLADGSERQISFLQPGAYRAMIFGSLFSGANYEEGIRQMQTASGYLSEEQRRAYLAVTQNWDTLETLDRLRSRNGNVPLLTVQEFVNAYMQAQGQEPPQDITRVIYQPSENGHPRFEKPAARQRQQQQPQPQQRRRRRQQQAPPEGEQ